MTNEEPNSRPRLTLVDAPPTFVMLGELLAEPEEHLPYVLEGILVTGGTSMVVAKPKVGKTTFVEHLALATSRGEPFLGRETHGGMVLFLALEEKRAEVARSFQALGAGQESIALWVCNAPEAALDWLADVIQNLAPVLVVIDTVQRFFRLPDLNDYAIVSNALEPITALARQTGTHILMAHHGNKGGGSDGDAVLGSTALFGSVDTLIEIRRSGGRRTIWTDQRYGDNLEESVLALNVETRRLSLAGAPQEVEADSVAQTILDYLAMAGEWVDGRKLFDAVGGSHALHLSALNALVEQGTVRREGEGKRGSPFVFNLSDQPDA